MNNDKAGIAPLQTSKNEMTEQMLQGLLRSFLIMSPKELHINRQIVFEKSKLPRATFDYYFATSEIIMDDAQRAMAGLFDKMLREKKDARLKVSEWLQLMLDVVRENKTVVTIFLLLEESEIWEGALFDCFTPISADWIELTDDELVLMYKFFCRQFETVVKDWYDKDFSEDYQEECFKNIYTWYICDGMFKMTRQVYFNEGKFADRPEGAYDMLNHQDLRLNGA